MKNCKGLFGRIFGHNFVSRIVSYTPNQSWSNIKPGYATEKVLESLAIKKYVIICKRCGVRK